MCVCEWFVCVCVHGVCMCVFGVCGVCVHVCLCVCEIMSIPETKSFKLLVWATPI